MKELEAAEVGATSATTSYLGAGHQLELWDKKIYTTLTAPYKGHCSAGDWSAIGTTKGEIRDRWAQHLYGVMQKRRELSGEAREEPITAEPSPDPTEAA